MPSTPDPEAIALAAGQLRALLAALAGMGILGGVWASVSANEIATILTAVLTLSGLVLYLIASVWSWWQKAAAARAAHRGAVASAATGVATKSSQT